MKPNNNWRASFAACLLIQPQGYFNRSHALCSLVMWIWWIAPMTGQEIMQTKHLGNTADTSYVDALSDRAWSLFNTHQNDSLIAYAEQALEIAHEYRMPYREARASLLLAYGMHNGFQHLAAIGRYEQYIALQEDLNAPYDTSLLLLNLAKCNTHIGKVEDGLRYFDAAFDILDPNDFKESFEYYRSLAWFFHRNKLPDRAIHIRLRVHQLASEEGDSSYLLTAIYDLGTEFYSAGQYDSALYYVRQATLLAESLEDRWMQWLTKACLGIVHVELGHYAEGLRWLEIAEPIGAEFGQDLCCGNGAYHALALIMEGREDEAQPYLRRARKQLPGIDDIQDKRDVLKALYQAYEAVALPAEALDAYKRLQALDDTIARHAYLAEVAALDVKNNTRDLLQKIEEQQSQISGRDSRITRFSRIIKGLVAVLMVSLGILYFEYRKRKKITQKYLQGLDQMSVFATPHNATETEASPLRHVEQAILKHLENPDFRIVDLARSVGQSQRNLNRLVRAKSGMTPVQLVRTLRVEKAKVLLSRTDKNVSEIAYEIGFTDPSYFSKIFTEMQGCSPTLWRKSG